MRSRGRFLAALRLEALLQWRAKFVHAALFSGLLWLIPLLALPDRLRRIAEPYAAFGDIAIIGYFFIAGQTFLEKDQRTLYALATTPLRFTEQLAAKLAALVGLSLTVAVTVATACEGTRYRPLPLLAGVALGSAVLLLSGWISATPFRSVTDWLLPAQIPLALLAAPLLHFSGIWPSPLLYAVPTQGPLQLIGFAFGQCQLAGWQLLYALAYPTLCAAGLMLVARRAFRSQIVQGRAA